MTPALSHERMDSIPAEEFTSENKTQSDVTTAQLGIYPRVSPNTNSSNDNVILEEDIKNVAHSTAHFPPNIPFVNN
jgi:hypothetical protein